MSAHLSLLAVATVILVAGAAAQPPVSHKTDWFSRAGYGVFTHYLWDLQDNPETVNSLGKATSWEECVREFDTERYAEQMKQAGAGYVIFTMQQRTRYLIAPNATFDRLTGYKPGEACSTRDLVLDLYKSLAKRGIPLMLYWTGDGPRQDPKAAAGMKCPPDGQVTEEFVRNWASVVKEYGERYGDEVKGWWCDGAYPFIGYDETKLGILAEGLRAGNHDRIVALNVGVQDKVRPYSVHEDFTTGEQNSFTDIPASRFVGGEQWHILSFLGADWGQAGVKLGKKKLADYVSACNSVGGVVSIDVLLYRDGSIERSQLEVLKSLRAGIEERKDWATAWKRGKAVPPTNKAWHKPAHLLSLNGTPLGPSVGEVHDARYGVDGDPETSAVAGGDYAWAYEVDLQEALPIKRVVVNSGPGFATDLDIAISTDREHWTVVGRWQRKDNSRLEATLAEQPARFVRVRSYKPDGENQPGGQMQIAELEVY